MRSNHGEFGQCIKEDLTKEDIRNLLRQEPIRFIVIDVGPTAMLDAAARAF